MSDTARSSYDEMPYVHQGFAQSHPDRLATMAKLFGMASPVVDTCRVLELGCASGGNLIPMALGLPRARFVGVDLSGRQIEQGRDIVRALALDNIELRHGDIADVVPAWGSFDYIVCHGIYSWVPARIRERILAICHDNLAPDGVAYVSYNTFPGWRMRGMIRDMMVYHARRFEGAAAKVGQARALLDFLSQSAPTDTPYGMTLKSELDSIRTVDDAYLFHDHLEEVNEPVYFHEFIEATQRHGLQYLAEAEFGTMMSSNFSPQVAETLRRIAPDIVSMEQYMDFVRNRTFRQTLLIHQDVPLKRDLDWRVMGGMQVAACAVPAAAAPSLAQGTMESFRAATGATLNTGNAITKAAMLLLPGQWPLGLPFTQLVAASRASLRDQAVDPSAAGAAVDDERLLGNDLLQSYAAGIVEFHVWSPRLGLNPSSRPAASPLARLQAQRGRSEVINLRHEPVALDAFGRSLVPLLDGSRGRESLVAALAWMVTKGTLRVEHEGQSLTAGPVLEKLLRGFLDEQLPKLAKAALLLD